MYSKNGKFTWENGDKAEVYKNDRKQCKYPNLIGEIVTIERVLKSGVFDVVTDYGKKCKIPRGWLRVPGSGENPTKPKKPSQILHELGIAAYKQRCQERYEHECKIMDQSAQDITDQIKSGEIVVESKKQLQDMVWGKYRELGGTDLIRANAADIYNLLSAKFPIMNQELPVPATKEIKEMEKQEVEETKETFECVSFDEVMTGFEAIAKAKASMPDDADHAVLLDLAVSGLKSKVCGKVVE